MKIGKKAVLLQHHFNFEIGVDMQSKVLIIQNAMTQLESQIHRSSLSIDVKNASLLRIHAVDVMLVVDFCERAVTPLTKGNLLYVICFVAGLDTQVIARIFNVEPATVYTVRYRLRARLGKINMSPF